MLLWDIHEIAPGEPKAEVTRCVRIGRLLPSGIAQLFAFFRIEWAALKTEAEREKVVCRQARGRTLFPRTLG
jgi:hypothetical protein